MIIFPYGLVGKVTFLLFNILDYLVVSNAELPCQISQYCPCRLRYLGFWKAELTCGDDKTRPDKTVLMEPQGYEGYP
jgi:hypothetical protein